MKRMTVRPVACVAGAQLDPELGARPDDQRAMGQQPRGRGRAADSGGGPGELQRGGAAAYGREKPKSLCSDPFGQSIVCANKHQVKSVRGGRRATFPRPVHARVATPCGNRK